MYQFFYVGKDEIIKENPSILPLDVLSMADNDDGLIFRFCFDKESNKIYIQDESFRQSLLSGNKDAWRFLNHCLKGLSKDGARFLEQVYGDPLDSGIFRKMSDYDDTWKLVRSALMAEFNANPINMRVYEYVATPEKIDNTIELLPVGTIINGNAIQEPAIGINRLLNKSSCLKCTSEDVNHSLIGVLLAKFYLDNISKIAEMSSGEDAKWLSKRLENKTHMMLALLDKEKTRIFAMKDKMFDEAEIRKTLKNNGPIVLFSFNKNNNTISIKNSLLSHLYSHPDAKKMVEEIISNTSKATKVPKHKITITCDSSMGHAFKSRLSKYKPVWTLAESPDEIDMDVLEVPFHLDNPVIVKNRLEEDNIPNMSTFRAARGIDASYPFMVVSNLHGMGHKIRQMLDTYMGFFNKKIDNQDEDQMQFIMDVNDDDFRSKVKYEMEYLLSLGLNRHDILDFFAPESMLFRRSEYRKILEEVLNKEKRTLIASMGKGLGINDWFIGSQESLNRSEHTNSPENKKVKPFNLKNKKKEQVSLAPRSYEQLLRTKHDKDLGYQKSVEQLLRESQI